MLECLKEIDSDIFFKNGDEKKIVDSENPVFTDEIIFIISYDNFIAGFCCHVWIKFAVFFVTTVVN